MARCDPQSVEAAAGRFRAAIGAVPAAVEAAAAAVDALVDEIEAEIRQIDAELADVDPSPEGVAAAAALASDRARAVVRLATASDVASRFKDLQGTAGRIDGACGSLAEHLSQVAMFARDIARGGMPEPMPRRSSASSDDVRRSLDDLLRRTGVSPSELPELPGRGPAAPDDPRDAIEPTDSSNWWER